MVSTVVRPRVEFATAAELQDWLARATDEEIAELYAGNGPRTPQEVAYAESLVQHAKEQIRSNCITANGVVAPGAEYAVTKG
jgi:hypothetical protein